MNKKTLILSVIILTIAILSIVGAAVQPQLSQDEQNIIVDSVIQTINPQALADSIGATVEARVLTKIGLIPDTSVPTATAPSATLPVLSATVGIAENLIASVTPESYQGLHAKFVNSYAYTEGGDNGNQKTFETEYTPNTLFTFDVVFENDGTVNWPPQVEMRNTGSVSTYTGHRPNVIVDTSNNPVKPGDRLGFSISAHGSEELGWHTFYFQLYDAVSGVPIPGGYGYFSYLAK